MKEIKSFLFLFASLFFFTPVYSQDNKDSLATEASEEGITFMVQSLQTMFNLLGDPDVSRADKDVILNQSYLKYFKDDKVQIEDDLDPNRQLPMNKDAQSYLQDVVFFFKDVQFKFEIKEITKGLSDNDEIFYKASLNRIYEGTNLYGDPVRLVGDRYIEFNYTEGSEEYKIASIYTTKLSEKDDIEAWWDKLDKPWRNYFANNIVINDSLNFDSLKTQNVQILRKDTSINGAFELMAGDTFVLNSTDTIFLSDEGFYKSILGIFKTDTLLIAPSDSINNLVPLEKLTELTKVSFKGCPIDDVRYLRTLLKLQDLDASGSLISNLDDLQYLSGLETLDVSNTQLTNLDVSEAFENLQFLNISSTLIKDVSFFESIPQLINLDVTNTSFDSHLPISKISSLQTLNLSKTNFNQFEILGPLEELQTLRLNKSSIENLNGIFKVANLVFLSINGTAVTSLKELESIESLKMVYCDDSEIDADEVRRFISVRPEVLVIYETELLSDWWENINPELKGIIIERLDSISNPPDTETLHKIIFTEKVDLNGYSGISNLESLKELINVKEIYLSGTNVSDLEPLESLKGITILDVSKTKVEDVSAIRNLTLLKELNVENTSVEDLKPLSLLTNLEIIYADNSAVDDDEVAKFRNTSTALVLYQSDYLLNWWGNLENGWKKYFRSKMDLDGSPNGANLQTLVNLDSLVIPESYNISDLKPLIEFKYLSYLKLDDLDVTDISILSDIITIENLTITGGPVSDFSSIVSLYNLEKLDLSKTALNNLEFIIQLPNLKSLSVQATAIIDLKPIGFLKELEFLDISYTKVRKLKPLKDAVRLKELRCTNTDVKEKEISKLKDSNPGLKVKYY